jgi:hypothetical protein
MNYPHPILAKEGWAIMAGAFVVALLVSAFAGVWSLPFWVIFFFCMQFFRDPPRQIAGGPKSVLAAADGRVVAIEEADDPYLNRRALKISVFMNGPAQMVQAGQLPQRLAGQGLARERALRAASEDGRWARHHLRPDRRPDCPPHPQLRRCRNCAGSRAALRLHSLRLARRCLCAARQPRQGGDRRQGLRVELRARRAILALFGRGP